MLRRSAIMHHASKSMSSNTQIFNDEIARRRGVAELEVGGRGKGAKW
jgi:hypothetical protein